MSEETKLLPCPFCGITPDNLGDSGLAIEHQKDSGCPLQEKVFFIDEWNLRATPPDQEMVPKGTMEAVAFAITKLTTPDLSKGSVDHHKMDAVRALTIALRQHEHNSARHKASSPQAEEQGGQP